MPSLSSLSNQTLGGMLRSNTPLEDHTAKYGLWVKREDLACPAPGPPFSKARGVFKRIAVRPEKLIGALDTKHSKAGWAVARASQVLGKKCVNYYPAFKLLPGPHIAQLEAQQLGAELVPLKAGRSAILYHAARKDCEARGGYMMPNALKLEESVVETAREVPNEKFDFVIIPISSGTIAAGVIKGFMDRGVRPRFIIHLGYSRSHDEVLKYLRQQSGYATPLIEIADEKYAYADSASPGLTPPWPCNEYYDLKAFRWWMQSRRSYPGRVLFWNIG